MQKKSYSFILLTMLGSSLMGCANKHVTKVPVEPIKQQKTVKVKGQSSFGFNFEKSSSDIYLDKTTPEVFRQGQYTFVTSNPSGGQKYLLRQIVSLNLPTKVKRKYVVKEGIEAVLKNSGYSLCETTDPVVLDLWRKPLPLVHYRFNNMHLDEALQMLMGKPFQLSEDKERRVVCFSLK